MGGGGGGGGLPPPPPPPGWSRAFSLLFTRILCPEPPSSPSRLIVVFPNPAFVPSQGFPNPALYFVQIPEPGNTFADPVLQWYGHPRVLGISILKALEIWASPSFINLAIWLKVRVTGDVHITRGFGNGDAQTAGTPISQWHRWLKVLWEWSLEKWGQLTSMQKFIIQTFFWSSLDMAYKTYPWKNQLYSPIHPSLLKTISA